MSYSASAPSPTEPNGSAAKFTLAVIGHVNHGKSALVTALTGTQTDRLKEEIDRGLSIVLGFAWRAYGGVAVDFIDAPGHEGFIRTTTGGMTGARAVLLAVSAVEGVGRQTLEHLQIAKLLGLHCGIVAVTKADLVSAEDEATVRQRITAALQGSILETQPIIFCSAQTGAGLPALHAEIAALAKRTPSSEPLPGAFMPIDRAFTIPGAGTVVTGTLLGAALRIEDEAALESSGRRVSLRQIQIHGQACDVASPGGRVAVGLRGVMAGIVKAGDVLCSPGAFQCSRLVDVQISLVPEARRLRHLDQVRVLWGARYDVASVRLFGGPSIEPGTTGLAQLRFPGPVIAFAGQRAILRCLSPAATIAGVTVLDPVAPTTGRRVAHRTALLQSVLDEDLLTIASILSKRDKGPILVVEAARLARLSTDSVRKGLNSEFLELHGASMAPRSAVAAAQAAYLEFLAVAHQQAPARFAINVALIRRQMSSAFAHDLIIKAESLLAASQKVRLDSGRVALFDHDPLAKLAPASDLRLRQIEQRLASGGVQPASVAELTGGDAEGQDLVDLLVASGRAVSRRNDALRQTIIFHRQALHDAITALRAAYPPPAEFTTGEARATLLTTRKFIVPMLEYFDSLGITKRQADLRQVVLAGAAEPAQLRGESR